MPNYAFKPIAEQALRSNQTMVPQRLNAALGITFMLKVLLTSVLLFGLTEASYSCDFTEGRDFSELVAEAESIAIVRVEGVALEDSPRDIPANPADRLPISVQWIPSAVASVRVVETLVGKPARVASIAYIVTSCAGHRLAAGSFYVIALKFNSKEVTLRLDEKSLLGLGDEYMEGVGGEGSESELLQRIIEFRNTGSFPPEKIFSTKPFEELVRAHFELPSKGVRR